MNIYASLCVYVCVYGCTYMRLLVVVKRENWILWTWSYSCGLSDVGAENQIPVLSKFS